MTKSERRRICWPEFDATCLEGGCLYCNDNPYRSVNVIRKAVDRMKITHNRGNGAVRVPLEAFLDGQRAHWRNADTEEPK